MDTQSNLRECADCLCLASRRAARRITRAFDRELRPHGMRATQFTVLAMLSLRGAMTIGELAEALGAERTTLTRNLALIENASWVRIQPGETDARARVVTITDHGRRESIPCLAQSSGRNCRGGWLGGRLRLAVAGTRAPWLGTGVQLG
jgi:DNA-binding MarR family transcriptional regulator